jgi:basic amino acid/polyamine antiporter, APA family
VKKREAGLPSAHPHLLRVVTQWDLTAQGVNIVLASSVFVLPGITLVELGAWSPIAVIVAGLGIMCILLSLAEAAGRCQEAGGPYRYTADAFGEYVGSQVGILYWAVRASATAAVANVFVTYWAELFPLATKPVWRAFLLSAVILGSGYLNVRGTRQATSKLNFLTVVKAVPLLLLCAVGFFYISWHKFTMTPFPQPASWARAVLLWVFAFGGIEATLIPASEARNPTHDMPRALLKALAIVIVIYVAVQILVVGLLPATPSSRPIGEAAHILFGGAGAVTIALAAILATSSHIGGSALVAPRITFAIADRGSLPAVLARVHPRFKTPAVSIAVFSVMVWVLAISGSYIWNASVSAVGRLTVFELTFFATLRLRKLGPSAFPVPIWVHLLAIMFCAWLFLYQTLDEALSVATVIIISSAVYLVWRFLQRRAGRSESAVQLTSDQERGNV